MTGIAYYVGPIGPGNVYHVTDENGIVCGESVVFASVVQRFRRIKPELAAEAYNLCRECEPDLPEVSKDREEADGSEVCSGDGLKKVAATVIETPMADKELPIVSENNWKNYQRHYLSEVCGDMPAEDFDQMMSSVEESDEPVYVWLYEDMVLDGWHRLKACIIADRKPIFLQYELTDPGGFALRQNVFRRHMTPSQRAGVLAGILKWQDDVRLGAIGMLIAGNGDTNPTQSDMADFVNVSPRILRSARRAENEGLGHMLRDGGLSASLADSLVAEGLTEEVISGEMTLAEARAEVEVRRRERAKNVAEKQGDQPKRRKHRSAESEELARQVERVESHNEQLAMNADTDRKRIDELEEEIAFLRAEFSPIPQDREALFNRYRSDIEGFKGSIRNLQRDFNEANQQARYWETRARRAERMMKESGLPAAFDEVEEGEPGYVTEETGPTTQLRVEENVLV